MTVPHDRDFPTTETGLTIDGRPVRITRRAACQWRAFVDAHPDEEFAPLPDILRETEAELSLGNNYVARTHPEFPGTLFSTAVDNGVLVVTGVLERAAVTVPVTVWTGPVYPLEKTASSSQVGRV